MNSPHNNLIIALLLVSFMSWLAWEQDKHKLEYHSTQRVTIKTAKNFEDNKIVLHNNQGKLITVKTDVLELKINTNGGNIDQALILPAQDDLKSQKPFILLETTPEFIYQAQSGLINHNCLDHENDHIHSLYYVNQNIFEIQSNQNKLTVPLTWIDNKGNIFIKTFILKRGEYSIDIKYNIYNSGNKPLIISDFGQLKHSVNTSSYHNANNNNFTLHTFHGAAYSTTDKKYKKYKFNAILDNKNLNIYSKAGWVAMLQQYFTTAWIPHNNMINNFYTTKFDNNVVAIGYKSQPVIVQPGGQTNQLQSTLWVGPAIQDKMGAIAPYLDLTVDYGWLWFIAQPLFKLLRFIYNFLGNWGFAIIIITFIVRGIMYPLSKIQYISMAKIRMLQPQIQAIRERVGDDKHRQSKEIIALYKSEKVNPLGGCFPILIQMPIFLALYYMLISSAELRHAPFILWINDLSAQDPYYILPIIMGITMFLIQKLSPNTITDLVQQKIMFFIPIILTIFFLWLPSGLVLYYIISNFVTIIQQHLIYHDLKNHDL